MKGKLGEMMRQAQRMQEDLHRAQAELESLEVTGEAGGGLVAVTMDGKHRVRRVAIAPEVLAEEHAMIEDLLAVATNDAVSKVAVVTEEKMGAVTAGLPLPPGMRPF